MHTSARFSARFCFSSVIATVFFAASGWSQAPNPAVVPADRLSEPWWAERHKAVLAEVAAHTDTQLLMIGDSITNNYDKAEPPYQDFQPTWKQFYAPRGALNLGFSGDTTANVLWRLDHGEVEGLKPRAAVLLIGTNNTGVKNQTAQQTEAGIDAVIADLEERLPETHILLLGLLPSEISEDKSRRDSEVNQYLVLAYGENKRVTYLDVQSIFYKSGALDTSIFYDPHLDQPAKALHPDTHGQRMMAEAIEPTLAKLMGEPALIPLEATIDINPALIPVDWLEQDSYDWYARHHAALAMGKQLQPRVVMLGDSITHFWGGEPFATHMNGAVAWQQAFAGIPVLNLGFGWDRTQNVLWRLRQGEMDGLRPEWVVLNIGTNNLTGTAHARASTPEEAAAGVAAVVQQVHERAPQARVVLMAIFPRGAKAGNPLRLAITQTNALLAARFANDSSVTWLDIGQKFLTPDGSLPAAMMPDGTHPSEAGYQIWATALMQIGIKP